MQVMIKSFIDRNTQVEMFRVILRTDAGDLSSRPSSSMADAMSHATKLAMQLGLGSYELDGKKLSVSKVA